MSSVISTQEPVTSILISSYDKWIVSRDGTILGLLSSRAQAPDFRPYPIPFTAAEIAAPTADMLADTRSVYALSTAPFTRYRSNGSALVVIGDAGILATTPAKLVVINVTVGTLAAGDITGASHVTLVTTNATPGTQTTRTATQMFADAATMQVGQSYTLRITNTGAGTLTLGAGAGVTLTGTMTVPVNTTRDFVVTFNSATTLTIRATGTGTFS